MGISRCMVRVHGTGGPVSDALLGGRAPGRDDLDFAVFRFTLGIPGFDDDSIPRVVGILGLLLLSANHLAAGSAAGSASLVRTINIPDFMQQL